MKRTNIKCGVTLEDRRSCSAGSTEQPELSGSGLFARDWEVFVARFDKELGRFVTSTFCCEDEVPAK